MTTYEAQISALLDDGTLDALGSVRFAGEAIHDANDRDGLMMDALDLAAVRTLDYVMDDLTVSSLHIVTTNGERIAVS